MSGLIHEYEYNIPTPDGQTIYGRYTPGNPDKPHVVLAPSNGGDYDDSLIRDNARALTERDFPTFRFNFYDGWSPNARKRTEVSTETQAEDLNTIAAYLTEKEKAEHIAAIGHSLAGIAIMLTRGTFDRAALLDPSHPKSGLFQNGLERHEERLGYYSTKSEELRCGKVMKDHLETLDITELAEDYTTPTRIITAGGGVLVPYHEEYVKLSPGVEEQVIIPKADHSFTHESHRQAQIESTIEWLDC